MSSRILRVVPFVLALAAPPAGAMFEDNETGVRAEGMASAFTAVADDISAIDFNPAGLYQVGTRSFAASYKVLYGGAGAGLHTAGAAVALPLGRFGRPSGTGPRPPLGTLAVRVQETGFDLQAQRSLKVAYGLRLAEGLGLGLGLSGYNLHQQGFGNGYAAGVDVGMFGRVYRSWTVGVFVHNVNMPRIGESDLPRLLAFGLGYSPRPGIQSALDITKEPGMPTRVTIGQEFRIIQDHLTLRAGVQTEPVRMGFGLRAGTRRLHVDYAMLTHSVLPFTHDFGVAFDF